MKITTMNLTTVRSRGTCFIGSILMLALMMSAVAMSQYSNPAPVNLGTSGNFVILAETGISTTGVTAITGDIGISPAAASFITGFALILPTGGAFSTSALVTGKVYAPGYADPTPATLTTAVLNMGTAYTTAAGLPPNATELYSGDLTGQTLTRGVYKWGSAVTIGAGGVTISGSATDVWIFQIAQNLTLASGAIVHLSGGAMASNIFWQVAGQVNLGTTAQMEGIILCQTQIAMTNGATLEGRALAQTAVTLIGNTITQPAAVVVTLPTVTSTDPVNAAIGVALNRQITAVFSKTMDASTISASTFTLMQGTNSVSGVVSYSGTTAAFAPASNLLPNSLYTATITTGAKDMAGNALANSYVWSFTTGAAVAVNSPTVTSTDPVNAATGVALNKQITAIFSTTMDASTISVSTFTFMQGTNSVSGLVSYSGTTATFAPASNLLPNSLYTATITTGAKDVAGNALANNYVWSFTTAAATGTATVSGTVAYASTAANAIGAVSVVLTPTSGTALTATSSASGTYSIANVPAGTYTLTASKTGNWGGCTAADALLITRHVVGLSLLTGLPSQAADVNASSSITAADALLIIRRVVGLDVSFTGGDWVFTSQPVTVASVNVTANVTGLAMGDVNASYTTSGAFAKSTPISLKSGTDKFSISGSSSATLGAVTMKIKSGSIKVASVSSKLPGFVSHVDNAGVSVAWYSQDGKPIQSNANEPIVTVMLAEKAGDHSSVTIESELADITGATLNSDVAITVKEIPTVFELSQNYPNPFNPTTRIHYSLEKAAQVTLKVYNVLGLEIATLVNGSQEAGSYTVMFNTAMGTFGLSSGVYFYRLEAGSFVSTKRLILMK